MPEEIDTSEDHLLVDLSPEQPFNASDAVVNAVSALQDALYESNCGVNGLVITVPELDGTRTVVTTDHGEVHIVPEEI